MSDVLRTVVVWAIALLLSGPSWAQRSVPVDVTNPATDPVPTVDPGYRFIGFSTNSTTGSSGLGLKNRFCHATFGSDARICTTDEILRTPDPFRLIPGGALTIAVGWVQPSVHSIVLLPNGQYLVSERSRTVEVATPDISCEAWSCNSQECNGWIFFERNIPPLPVIRSSFGTARCSANSRTSCCVPHAQWEAARPQ